MIRSKLRCSRVMRQDGLSICLNREDLKEIGCFRYWGLDVTVDETMRLKLVIE